MTNRNQQLVEKIKISISELYRMKKEFEEGLEIVNRLLGEPSPLQLQKETEESVVEKIQDKIKRYSLRYYEYDKLDGYNAVSKYRNKILRYLHSLNQDTKPKTKRVD